MRARPVRLIGGPLDGQTMLTTGGIMIEIPNPDKAKWGDYDFLAYGFEENGNELTAKYWELLDS